MAGFFIAGRRKRNASGNVMKYAVTSLQPAGRRSGVSWNRCAAANQRSSTSAAPECIRSM
jgi:hypothetical protein